MFGRRPLFRRFDRRMLRGSPGDGEFEIRAAPQLARHFDFSAVKLNQVPGDEQSQAGAHFVGASRLPVLVEDVGQFLTGDSGAGILDTESHGVG